MSQDSLIKKRSEVAVKDCWNVEVLYSDLAAWEQDFALWGRPGQEPRYPELDPSHFNLHSIADVKKILDLQTQIERRLDLLGTYAHLRHDEDVAADPAKKAYMLASWSRSCISRRNILDRTSSFTASSRIFREVVGSQGTSRIPHILKKDRSFKTPYLTSFRRADFSSGRARTANKP